MRKRTISKEEAALFEEVSAGFPGCWSDEIRIDKMIVESNTCPGCWKPLKYRGFSNMTAYRAFGICEPCQFAKQFWAEGAELATAKKNICRAAESSVA
jgi:hypothetical protein